MFLLHFSKHVRQLLLLRNHPNAKVKYPDFGFVNDKLIPCLGNPIIEKKKIAIMTALQEFKDTKILTVCYDEKKYKTDRLHIFFYKEGNVANSSLTFSPLFHF